MKNVFSGEKGIFQYLTPGSTGPSPLVELPSRLNPFAKDGVHIFVKLMQTVPLANIKSLPSYFMLDSLTAAERKKIKHLVEYSSGNTVMSLAVLSRHFGIPNMHAIITPDVPKNKQNFLRLVGAKLIISDGVPSPDVFGTNGGIWDAKEMGKRAGWHNFNQYVNENNPKASYNIIGKEIAKQLPDIGIFCASLGTGGTILGAGKYLKSKNPNTFVLGTSIKRGNSIPGPRNEDAVKKLGLRWEDFVDKELPVETKPAFQNSLGMIREGLFVGPSTGMQLAGLLGELKRMKKNGELKKLKGKKRELNAVFVACDTMFPYIEDYFDILKIK